MNLLTAILILGVMKIIQLAGGTAYLNPILDLARLSLFLCFFNLLPIPPLDGGHILRNLVGMSDEAYHLLSQYSFLFLLLILRVPAIGQVVSLFTNSTLVLLAWPFGWHLSIS